MLSEDTVFDNRAVLDASAAVNYLIMASTLQDREGTVYQILAVVWLGSVGIACAYLSLLAACKERVTSAKSSANCLTTLVFRYSEQISL